MFPVATVALLARNAEHPWDLCHFPTFLKVLSHSAKSSARLVAVFTASFVKLYQGESGRVTFTCPV